jgi:hypothetical protein
MAANSLYLLVIIDSLQKIRGPTVLRAHSSIRRNANVFSRWNRDSVCQLGSAYHSAGMSDLAIYRQLTGEREDRMPKTQRSYLTPFPVFMHSSSLGCCIETIR